MADTRVVYGMRCTWWGSINEVALKGENEGRFGGLPVSPCCGSPLFEMANEVEWWTAVDTHEAKTGQRGYRQFIEWLRGKCFTTQEEAMKAFYAEGHPT